MTTSSLALVAACCAAAALVSVATAMYVLYERAPAGRDTSNAPYAKDSAGPPPLPAGVPSPPRRRRRSLTTGVALGLFVCAVTGWPVHGLLVGAAAGALVHLLCPDDTAAVRAERLEALAEWLHQLAAAHTTRTLLAQSLFACAEAAPAPLAPNVRALTERLRAGMEAPPALALFAGELHDGAVDHVVLFLRSHAGHGHPGLAGALRALAVTTRQRAADARAVAAERARAAVRARTVCAVTCVTATGCLLAGDWFGCYTSLPGQLALLLLGGGFGLTLLWMRRITGACTRPDPRLLDPAPAHPTELTDARAR